MDLLTFECFLAEASDGIILFLESYGTACELGSFASQDNLARKMLILEDVKYKNKNSFLNEGPIKKIKGIDSSNVIYVDLKAILSSTEVNSKLRNFVSQKKCFINREEKKVKINAFMIEILELIDIIGPVRINDLLYIYKYLKEFKGYFEFDIEGKNRNIKINIKYIFDLLSKSSLIKINKDYVRINNQYFNHYNFMFDMNKYQFSRYRQDFFANSYPAW